MQNSKAMPKEEFIKKCTGMLYALKQAGFRVNMGHDRDQTFFQYSEFMQPPIVIYNSETEGVVWSQNVDIMTKREKYMGKAEVVE